MKKLRKMKGITLIALVITIIILLILAGITVATLSNSGLFGKTQESKEKWENAENDEKDKIAKYENEIDNYVGGGRTIPANTVELEADLNDYIATFSYPDGFNSSNTYVIAAKVYRADDLNWSIRRNESDLSTNYDTITLNETSITWKFRANTAPYSKCKILITKL